MGNPLLLFLQRVWGEDRADDRLDEAQRAADLVEVKQTSTFFLVMRRMRAPLIVLILIFSVSVFGLTLIPGVDATGQPWRMTVFDAFYFMSYTATTIGFGEIPYPFTIAQRMWVTVSIYLGVVGWAYAIGTLLSMLQDRDLRRALSARRFGRSVSHLGEPFLLLAGYGQAGQSIGRALDAEGRRFVVVDISRQRINALDLEPYRSDVPGLVADASVPGHLALAGLESKYCCGVLALTSDDRANLAVVTAAALLRPELPVVARVSTSAAARRMAAFGSPAVVNPFDAFGDHLRTALRAPAAYQLAQWLTSVPGAPLPSRPAPPRGPWVVLDSGQFGQEVQEDLRQAGLEVTLIAHRSDRAELDTGHVTREALSRAAGFVAGSDDDQRNLTALRFAREVNPGLFLIARQNHPELAPLYAATDTDLLLVAADVTAHEALVHLGSPEFDDFLAVVAGQDDTWADQVVRTITERSGPRRPLVWQVTLDVATAPTLADWLGGPDARLGDLVRSPVDRTVPLDALVLLLSRGDARIVTPADDTLLRNGDSLLLAGSPVARYALDGTLVDPAAFEYVARGVDVPTTWLGRRLARR